MRILIIEDEVKTAKYLRKGLREHGFIVDIIHDGVEGLFQAVEINYDLVVLDVMLPKMDGWDVIKALRVKKPTLPILFLTARDEVDDRVKGLELGADDYLVKPFAFSELLARVRALLKRGNISVDINRYTVDGLVIDLVKHTVTREGERIQLTQKEFALLALLVRKEKEVLTRTYIAEQVWDMNFDSDTNVVDVAMRRLRRKIDEPFERKLIHTVRGVGYVLEHRNN
jgi:two-component system copper resistance phosphate regulon response regulator CusR